MKAFSTPFLSSRSRLHLLKTLHNLRVTLLCGLLTFLFLRSCLGAGKFGTPVQDYDELRHHLHNLRLRRQHRQLLLTRDLAISESSSVLVRSTLPSQVVKPAARSAHAVLDRKASSAHAPRVMLVTGPQFAKCESAVEAQFLLKLLQNKMDYCSLHGIKVFFDTETDIESEVAKSRLLRKALVSHPEVEWMWWLDSAAMFTNMSHGLPYEMYAGHNVVVHNEGSHGVGGISVMVRNCEWTLKYLEDTNWQSQASAEVMVDMEMKLEVYGPSTGAGNIWPFITDFERCNVCGKGIDPGCLSHLERAFIFADGQHRHVASV